MQCPRLFFNDLIIGFANYIAVPSFERASNAFVPLLFPFGLIKILPHPTLFPLFQQNLAISYTLPFATYKIVLIKNL